VSGLTGARCADIALHFVAETMGRGVDLSLHYCTEDARVNAWLRVGTSVTNRCQFWDRQPRETSMDKDMASRILRTALALEAQIGELDGLISQLNDEKEKDDYVHALGDIIGIISKSFVFRIVRQYPDLDPDR